MSVCVVLRRFVLGWSLTMTPSHLYILQYQTEDATTRSCIIMLQIWTISDRRAAAES